MNSTEDKALKKSIDKVYRQGNIQKAIEMCQCEIAKDPAGPATAELHIKLGDLYMEWHLDISQAKQYIDEAITQYQQAMELSIESAELYYKIGRAFYYKNELNKAIDYFTRTIKKDEHYAKGFYALAECYSQRNEIYRAIEYVELALKNSKVFSSAYLLYFVLLKLSVQGGLKKFLKCTYVLIMSFLTLPFDKTALKHIAYLFGYVKFIPTFIAAGFCTLKEDYEKAIEIYKAAIERAPRFAFLYELLGGVYHAVNKDDSAICEFKMSIWLNSLNINAYKSLCYIYEVQEDYDNAIDVCRKLIKLQPYIAQYYSELASLLYMKDEVEESISNYQNAITLAASRKDLCRDAQFLGYVYHKGNQNFDAAIASYQIASATAPNDIDIYVNLGSAFYDKGEYENARVVYKKALEVDPFNAKIHCNLGYLYWGCGIIDEAIKSYELAIKYDETYAIAYNNLGVIYLDDLGRVQKAIELFESAIQYNPNYALAYYNLARTRAITSDKIEAAKLYQIAYDLNKLSNEIDPNEILDKIQKLFS